MAFLVGAALSITCMPAYVLAQSNHSHHTKASTPQSDDSAHAAPEDKLTELEAAFNGVWVGSTNQVFTSGDNDRCEQTVKIAYAFDFDKFDTARRFASGKHLFKLNSTAVYDPNNEVANPSADYYNDKAECLREKVYAITSLIDVVVELEPSADAQRAELVEQSCSGKCSGTLSRSTRNFHLLLNGQISYIQDDNSEILLSRN
jgi:hypothetical protein